MDMNSFNVSATLNVFRLIAKPALCLPHATIPTFQQLPIPLHKAFGKYQGVDIKAVVLDKDDCFAVSKSNSIHKPYESHFERLRAAYPGSKLLIVSNSAGTSSLDPKGLDALQLEKNTGVYVLKHDTKKPGCGEEIMKWFRDHPDSGVSKASQVAVVGDRLTTDVMLANTMGSYAVWVKESVIPMSEKSIFARLEQRFAEALLRRGYSAPVPGSPFED